MANFPTTFTEVPHIIDPREMPARFAKPFLALEHKGFEVAVGFSRDDIPQLAEIAAQEGVREFCHRDLAERWGTVDMAEKQLGKDGGRGGLRLKPIEVAETAGFGWTGQAGEDEIALTGAKHTFAIRMNEAYGGKGLAPLFTKAIVFGSMHFFGAKQIGWETWATNTRAVNAYIKAGAILTKAVASKRPTLDESYPLDEDPKSKTFGRHIRPDTRLYMRDPQSM